MALSVDLALTQDDARRLAQQGLAGSGGAQGGGAGGKDGGGSKGSDRRNLYLLKEGFIEEGSAVWAGMSENDRCVR